MKKYRAPAGQAGVNIGGQQFDADADGNVTVPDGDYDALLSAAGFVPVADAAPASPVPQADPVLPPGPAPEVTQEVTSETAPPQE